MGVSDRLRAVCPLAISAVTVFAMTTTALAGVDPADKCEASKLRETGKLASCVMTSLSKTTQAGTDPDQDALDSCGDKFTDKVAGAETKADGACPTTGDAAAIGDAVGALASDLVKSLSGERFIDNGDGTVTDTEQGVTWQQSTAGTGSPSSIDEVRTSCGILPHLSTINSGEGLGGRTDWSLPTLAQLQSILDCSSPPCVFVDPVLGPNPAAASVGSTYLLTADAGVFPMSTLPCMKLIAMEDGSIDCIDPTSTEGRSKVRTNNNAR